MRPVAPTSSVWRLGWRLSQNAPRPFWWGTFLFVVFFTVPALTGWLIGEVFDALSGGQTRTLYWLAAAVLGSEVIRMTSIHFGGLHFIASWTLMQSLLQSNMLAAQVASGGPHAGHPVASAGHALSYFRDDPEDVADFVDSWLDITGGLVFSVIAILILGATDWRATLIVLIPMVAVAAVTKMLDDKIKRARRADRDATAAFTSTLGDVLAAATTIDVNDAGGPVVEEVGRLADRRRVTAVRDRVLEDGLLSFAMGSGDVALGLMLVFSVSAIRVGDLGASEIALFAAFVARLNFLPRMIGRMLARRKQSQVSFENMASLVAGGVPSNTTRPRPLPERLSELHTPTITTQTLVPLERLTVERLSVRFGDVVAVDDVSLTLDRGSFTVITGPVGSGKSTLLRAILGLVWQGEVTGSVCWNGAEIEDRGEFLSPPHASFLPQVPQLLSDTLADNVLLGSFDANSERGADRLRDALRLAALRSDLEEMPEGTDTMVGPRGLRLSGGQRQRVATARALVRRPEVVVLDDLSSALDIETELELWRNLRADGLTVLAVSHRAVAFELADQVIELTGQASDSAPTHRRT